MNNKSVSISKGTLDHLNVRRVIKGKNFRRMSLPKIQGVNQKSLGLLIDQPELLAMNLTPMALRKEIGFESRTHSTNIAAQSDKKDEIGTSMV